MTEPAFVCVYYENGKPTCHATGPTPEFEPRVESEQRKAGVEDHSAGFSKYFQRFVGVIEG
jgi:hypothetical protein